MSRHIGIGLAIGIALGSGSVHAQSADTLFKPTQIEVKASEAELMAPARPLITGNAMNVFRRFDPKFTDRVVAFYTKALGLRPLSPIQLTATQQMILTGVGSGQVKLFAGFQGRRKYDLSGGYKGGTGIRFFTFTYPDEAALKAAFTAAGFPAPAFADQGDGTRAAMIDDPAGFPVELVIKAGAKPGSNDGVGVNIAASDIDKSRAFYREFVGLDEMPPVQDKLLGLTKYPYRYKETTLYLYQAASTAKGDNGSAGMQYVVSDAALVDAKGKRRSIPVETPLNNLSGFDLRTVWLNDPDGVTNYFAQVGQRDRTGQARAVPPTQP